MGTRSRRSSRSLLDLRCQPLHLERQLPDGLLEPVASLDEFVHDNSRSRRREELLVVVRLDQVFDTLGDSVSQGFHPFTSRVVQINGTPPPAETGGPQRPP
jgi:hypothetical protein